MTEADCGRGTGAGGRRRTFGGAVIHWRDQSIGVPGRAWVRCCTIRVLPAWSWSGLAACDGPTSMLLEAERPTAALPGRCCAPLRLPALESNCTDLDVPSPGCRAPGGAELGRPTAMPRDACVALSAAAQGAARLRSGVCFGRPRCHPRGQRRLRVCEGAKSADFAPDCPSATENAQLTLADGHCVTVTDRSAA